MSEKPTLLLVHGWGFDSGVWAPFLDALGAWPVVTIDLGFGGRAVDLETVPDRVVAVGHSLGFLWLAEVLDGREPETPPPWPRAMATVRERCEAMVSINGFTRFSRSPEFRAGVAPRVLARMTARATEAPAALLRDFRAQCGLPDGVEVGPGDPDPGRLSLGLTWLADWDVREEIAGWHPPRLALAAKDDGIVSPAHAGACFAGACETRLAWSETGHHLLPLTRPDWCAEEIRRFVAEVTA